MKSLKNTRWRAFPQFFILILCLLFSGASYSQIAAVGQSTSITRSGLAEGKIIYLTHSNGTVTQLTVDAQSQASWTPSLYGKYTVTADGFPEDSIWVTAKPMRFHWWEGTPDQKNMTSIMSQDSIWNGAGVTKVRWTGGEAYGRGVDGHYWSTAEDWFNGWARNYKHYGMALDEVYCNARPDTNAMLQALAMVREEQGSDYLINVWSSGFGDNFADGAAVLKEVNATILIEDYYAGGHKRRWDEVRSYGLEDYAISGLWVAPGGGLNNEAEVRADVALTRLAAPSANGLAIYNADENLLEASDRAIEDYFLKPIIHLELSNANSELIVRNIGNDDAVGFSLELLNNLDEVLQTVDLSSFKPNDQQVLTLPSGAVNAKVINPPNTANLYADNSEYSNGIYPLLIANRYTWTNAGADNNWNTTGNWYPNTRPPGNIDSGNTAYFDGNNPTTVHVDTSSISINNITFTSAGWTLGDGATVSSLFSYGVNSAGAGTNTINIDQRTSSGVSASYNVGVGNTLVMNGIISGSYKLKLRNRGTLRLTANNTYAGKTYINGGTLQLDGDHSAASGEVNVGDGGVLTGTGIVGSLLLVESGGTLSAGAPINTLTVKDNVSFADNTTTFVAHIKKDTAASSSRLAVTGNLTLNNTDLKITRLGSSMIGGISKYTIATYEGELDGTFNGLSEGSTIAIDEVDYVIRYADEGKNITLTANNPFSHPPVVSDATFVIAEDVAVGSNVGTVSATDADVGDTLSFAITAGNTNGGFAIDNNGNLTTASALDFETTTSYSLTVTVTDSGSFTDTATVSVNVTNITTGDDSDADNLNDDWEVSLFGNITSQSGNDDADNDGLNNVGEFLAGTDPKDEDTDNDGVNDGTEASQGTDPTNADNQEDIAKKYGKATQGTDSSYNYYSPASNAIDGDDSTNNHTRGDAAENWWQVELPSPTLISKIMIQGRSSNASRLAGAKVYITNTPYHGALSENDLVATLEGNANEQVTTFDSSRSGTYLIVKGAGDNHIHLATVEVYGGAPATPVFNEGKREFLIAGSAANGSTVTTITGVDYQGTPLVYSLDGTVPFAIDSQGKITVSGALAAGTYTFDVLISDGRNTVKTAVTIQVTTATAASDAITSGSVTDVTDQELIQATLDEISAISSFMADDKIELFNLNIDGTAKSDNTSLTNISWNPTHDASTIVPTLGKNNTSLLQTNAVTNSGYTVYNKTIAIIGEKSTARYMVMGSNPMRNSYRSAASVNEQMHQLMENSMSWLTRRADLKTATFNVVIAQLAQSGYFPDEVATRSWLDSHYTGQVNYNAENTCDGAALSSCLSSSTDLLIISQILSEGDDKTAIAATVNQALADGVAVLYLHHDGNLESLGRELFSSVFDVTYEWDNYWKKLSLSAYSPLGTLNTLSNNLIKIKTLFTHLKNSDYNFDWGMCKGSSGNMGENNDKCDDVTGLSSEFQDGATAVKGIINDFDGVQKNIFQEDGYRFQKLLVLTADKFRQSVVYPMDKVTTDDNVFMRSYYADHAIYNYRKINPAQANMGNFSRSDFSHITPITKTVNVTSKKNFRSTGAYALPGKTVKVTRNDSSDLTVNVFVNTLRSGATHQYQKNGYKRPKYLKTRNFELKTGDTIELTSPYGGTLQLSFSKNDLPVEVTFENVGEHAYWASAADDTSFTQKLDAGDFDWAEIATTGFEVHSTLKKMRASMADSKWGSAQALAVGTERYMSNFPHVIAGFKGPGIDVVPEIHDFATTKGWTINNLDLVKHMNADQAACGYGCSGNPYDAYWSYDPIGHGDVHELGHGLQGGMRFKGWENHSMTNHYSYHTKSKYNETVGSNANTCQSLPFESQFRILQASVGQADPAAYMQANLWDNAGWAQQAGMFIQMMMSAQQNGVVKNGWHIRARLHIMEREFKRADNNETDWLAKRDSLGFSSYTLAEAKAIDNNDWLLIAISTVTGMGYRDYLGMWGIPFSAKAEAQVASYTFTTAPKNFYISSATGYCFSQQNGDFLGKAALPIDGTQTWPAATDDDGDGYWNTLDNCLSVTNSDQLDTNGNGQGDACDTDSDNDGATTESDVTSFTGAGTGDGDGDGTADAEQAHVTSLRSHHDTRWLTYRNNRNGSQSNFITDTPPLGRPENKHLLHGAIQYDIATTAGQSVTIDVYVPKNIAIKDYYLLGNDGRWTAQNATVIHGENKTKLSFTVTEGGNFDRDATANGILQLAQGGVTVNTGLDAWPYAYLYGNVELGQQTDAKAFTIKNTGSRALAITGASIIGNNLSEFTVTDNTCTTLTANETCTISASFQPNSIGSKSAMLTVETDDPDNAKANIFLHNHEADKEESERRLPPVLNSFTLKNQAGDDVSSMQSNTQYTIHWSILGYHENYTSLVVMFNCTGIADNTSCGDSYSDSSRFLTSGTVTSSSSENGIWFHGDVQSKIFNYSHTFTTPDYATSTAIVIRFYRKNSKDLQVGNGSLSLIIPGNQAESYYDTTGRRVKNEIAP